MVTNNNNNGNSINDKQVFVVASYHLQKKDAKSKTSIYHLNNHRQLQRQQLKLKQKNTSGITGISS